MAEWSEPMLGDLESSKAEFLKVRGAVAMRRESE